MRFRCNIIFLGTLALSMSGHSAYAYKCAPLTFDANGVATVHEHIPDFLPLCYSFIAEAGQEASIDESKENKMSFDVGYDRADNVTIAEAVNAQSHQFTTDTKTYNILTKSDLRDANTAAYFTLTVSLVSR